MEDIWEICIFATLNNKRVLIMTAKEEVLLRFQKARQKKRECIARVEKSMKDEYEKRTGKTPDYFFAL